MIVTVALAAYCLLDLAVSAIVAMAWRTRAIAPGNLPPVTRSRRLLLFRLVPAAASTFLTLAVVLPAFIMFEPDRHGERSGPALALLAIVAAWQLALAITRAVRSLRVTTAVHGELLRHAVHIDTRVDPEMTAVESPVPFVALVGVFRPQLLASTSVLSSCDAAELALIAAHERGHLVGQDNLRRWILGALPDMLAWTPIHDEIVDAWHHACEDAADDRATGTNVETRAALAALLLKVVRIAPGKVWAEAVASPFVEASHALERRVRRLVRDEQEAPAPLAVGPMAALFALTSTCVAVLASPRALESVFDVFEALVELGR